MTSYIFKKSQVDIFSRLPVKWEYIQERVMIELTEKRIQLALLKSR